MSYPQTISSLSFTNLDLKRQEEANKKQSELNKKNVLSKDSAILNKKQDDYGNELKKVYDTLIIGNKDITAKCIQEVSRNNSKNNVKKSEDSFKKSILTTGISSMILSSLIWLLTILGKKAAKYQCNSPLEKTLPVLPRNFNLNSESHFAAYGLIQNPNYKTFMGFASVLALTFLGFIGKNFVDGICEIWVKKEEAKTEVNLQNSLIEVETNNFAGKLQIQREMLSNCANMFDKKLRNIPNKHLEVSFEGNDKNLDKLTCDNENNQVNPLKKDQREINNETTNQSENQIKKDHQREINNETTNQSENQIKKDHQREINNETTNQSVNKIKKDQRENIFYVLFGSLTLSAIGIMSLLSFKNIKDADKYCRKYKNNFYNHAENLINDAAKVDLSAIKQTNMTLEEIKSQIKKAIGILSPKRDRIDKMIEPLREKLGDEFEEYKKSLYRESEKITELATEAINGKPGNKAAYFSYIDDPSGHLYNLILNNGNPILSALFLLLTSVTCIGYITTVVIDAIRKIFVIKANANTELEMKKNLVETEMMNYKMKKNASIEPLIEEFDKRYEDKRDKEELKYVAENILYEIKNGAPYIFN